ncbi:MAG: hypothetical protein M0Z66_07280 [Thermaerobacter sp.]|nr:hypothetical protein [Thermaerobacter sp.]
MTNDFVALERIATSLNDALVAVGPEPEAHEMPCCYLSTVNALTIS